VDVVDIVDVLEVGGTVAPLEVENVGYTGIVVLGIRGVC
jgi:hypothetical protein